MANKPDPTTHLINRIENAVRKVIPDVVRAVLRDDGIIEWMGEATATINALEERLDALEDRE